MIQRVDDSLRKVGLAEPKPSAERRAVGEGWYRYGDSNPGPVAENHVS
jgi:hypothetical protein